MHNYPFSKSRTRGFERVSRIEQNISKEVLKSGTQLPLTQSNYEEVELFKDTEYPLPVRSTENSAGYDFFSIEYTTVPSVWKQAAKALTNLISGKEREQIFKPTLVATGVKAYMPDDEFLALYNRSSNPLKRFLLLANGVAVIDSDYYNNPSNDGEIHFQFINFGFKDLTIKPKEKIGQGIFQAFRKVDGDSAVGKRNGGFGSTGK